MKTALSADRPDKVKRLSKQFDLLQYEWDTGGNRNCWITDGSQNTNRQRNLKPLKKKFKCLEQTFIISLSDYFFLDGELFEEKRSNSDNLMSFWAFLGDMR